MSNLSPVASVRVVPSASASLKVNVGDRRIEVELHNVPVTVVATIVSSIAAVVEDNLPISFEPTIGVFAESGPDHLDVDDSDDVDDFVEVTNNVTKLDVTKPAKVKRAASAAGGGSLGCPECGKACASSQGLGKHRQAAHGIRGGARPDPTPQPQPNPPASPAVASVGDEDALRLRCSGCDFYVAAAEFGKLRSHTMTAHGGRLPSPAESRPRTLGQSRRVGVVG